MKTSNSSNSSRSLPPPLVPLRAFTHGAQEARDLLINTVVAARWGYRPRPADDPATPNRLLCLEGPTNCQPPSLNAVASLLKVADGGRRTFSRYGDRLPLVAALLAASPTPPPLLFDGGEAPYFPREGEVFWHTLIPYRRDHLGYSFAQRARGLQLVAYLAYNCRRYGGRPLGFSVGSRALTAALGFRNNAEVGGYRNDLVGLPLNRFRRTIKGTRWYGGPGLAPLPTASRYILNRKAVAAFEGRRQVLMHEKAAAPYGFEGERWLPTVAAGPGDNSISQPPTQ